MKRFIILLGMSLLLGGCVHQTLTEVPAFSGTVVDATTGAALAGVTFDGGVTDSTGRFSLPAKARTVWNAPIPGTGSPIERRLVFHKQGYRDTTCFCRNFALYAEDNRATIPLVETAHSEPASGEPEFLHVNDTIGCQAFVGSWVRYQEKLYLIGEIYTRTHNGVEQTLFSLWPVPPNEGEVVMDVSPADLQLAVKSGK